LILRFFDEEDFFLFSAEEINGLKKSLFKLPQAPQTDARWIKPGETVFVGKYEIRAGLFYFGSLLPSRYANNDPSLVNPALPLSKKQKQDPVFALPHDMAYAELMSAERRIYVEWLAGDRLDPNVPDWVPVLFLYGLERRMIDDCGRGIVPQEEQIMVRTEIERILVLYDDGKHNETIKLYSHFYQFVELKIADRKLYSFPPPRSLRYYMDAPIILRLAMGQCAAEQIPMPVDHMFRWYECGAYFRKTISYKRCAKEFETLFKIHYKKQYDAGIIAKPNKLMLHVDDLWYEPQTEALSFSVSYKIPPGLFDVLRSNSLLQKIEAIANECSQALAQYSRWLGREHSNLELQFGFLLLPIELWRTEALDASRLITNEAEREAMLKILKTLKKDSTEHKLQVIKYFNDVVFANYKTTYEAIHILESLYKCYGFDKTELYSNLHSAGSNAQTTQNEKNGIFILDKDKIKELRKDSEKVSTMLADIFADDEGVQIVGGKTDADLSGKTTSVKSVGGKTAGGKSGGKKIAGKTATKSSAKSVAQENKKAAAKRPLNLDARHAEFLVALIKKELWQKADLERLAKTHKLMADGAIETINEASFNEFDESLIEEAQIEVGAVYQFNSALVGKVKEMFAA
jgi:hypothetical protein